MHCASVPIQSQWGSVNGRRQWARGRSMMLKSALGDGVRRCGYVTLSGGAPAGDGAAHGGPQGVHPDLDGPDVLVVQQGAKLSTGIDLTNLDTTAVAGQDFFQFACGGFNQKHPLYILASFEIGRAHV